METNRSGRGCLGDSRGWKLVDSEICQTSVSIGCVDFLHLTDVNMRWHVASSVQYSKIDSRIVRWDLDL